MSIAPFASSSAAVAPISPIMNSNNSASQGSSAGVSGGKGNLNLGSTKPNVPGSRIKGLVKSTITVGGKKISVTNSSVLTPAEVVAVRQVINTGQQNIILGSLGNATGGSLQLSHALNSLVVPKNVTVLNNANTGLNSLKGKLNNSGTIIEIFKNGVHTADISAANIVNQRGALITTSSFNAAAAGKITLNLNSINDIVNQGTISSAGNLNLNAGGMITNALPGNSVGAIPLIQSNSNLSLQASSGKIVNAGMINSLSGDVNLNTQSTGDLGVLNKGGIIQATNGSINIRNNQIVLGNVNSSISGGTLNAKAINIYSGTGSALVDVQTLNGPLNINAGDAHVTTSSNLLQIGNINLGGDPTFYNTIGSVIIKGDLTFSGQDLAIIAKKDITTGAGAGAIDTSSATADGGTITLVAGVNFTTNGPDPVLPTTPPNPPPGDTTSTLTLHGASATGGRIDLATGSAITSLNSSSSKAGGSGGNITLLAFKGSDSKSGTVITPASVTLQAGGNGSGSNGNVTVWAGADTSKTTVSVSVGPIDTSGGGAGTGFVNLMAVQPAIQGTLQIKDGQIFGGGRFVTVGDIRKGEIDVNGKITAGSVNILSKQELLIKGDIDTSASGTGVAGTIYLSGRNILVQNLVSNGLNGAAAGSIIVYGTGKLFSGYVSADSDSSRNGGFIQLETNGYEIASVDSHGQSINVSSAKGSGGTLLLKDDSHKRLDVGSLSDHNGTRGSITADGFVDGGHIKITCCGNLAIFRPATISAFGATGHIGTITVENCQDQPITPVIIEKREERRRDDRRVDIRRSTVRRRPSGKPDPSKAPTDVTLSAPGGDDPDDIPDIGETDEKARIPADDKLISGAVVRKNLINSNLIQEFSAQGLILEEGKHTTNFYIERGNALLIPEKPIEVGFAIGAKLQVSKGSAIFVIDKGDDLEVLDFHDTGSGSVKLLSGDRVMKLCPGKVVVLTKRNVAEYKQATLTPKVGYRGAKRDQLPNGLKAFSADFSIPSGMISIVPLRNFMSKITPEDKHILTKILKNSAIIGDITPYAGPYVSGLQ